MCAQEGKAVIAGYLQHEGGYAWQSQTNNHIDDSACGLEHNRLISARNLKDHDIPA